MKLLPSSIVGRTALVLLVGLTVSHSISLIIYSDERRTELTSFGGKQISRRIAAAVEAVERTEPQERSNLILSLWGPGFSLTLSPESTVSLHDNWSWRMREVRNTLLQRLEGFNEDRIRVTYIRLADFKPVPEASSSDPLVAMQRHMRRMMTDSDTGSRERFNFMSRRWRGAEILKVSVYLSDGQWLNVAAPAPRFNAFWRSRMFAPIAFMGLVVIAFSFWAVRRATAPLKLFERAAERLGRDVNAPPMNEKGPQEVRRAARSFNNMQNRLKAFVDNRTHMLAAISHDLRTPITRLRLRAELIEDEETQKKILDDLAQMEDMIVATLAFARDEAASEASVPLDLAALLQSLCDDAADGGANASYAGPDKLTCMGRPVALMRAFQNLIDNAIKYGGQAHVEIARDDHTLTIHIDDAGRGIPEAEQSRVFDPFYRMESSRNRETGGVGLGLAVVRSVVSAHGGDISFGSNDRGGFRVTVTLPDQ